MDSDALHATEIHTQSSGMAWHWWFPSHHAKYKCFIPAALSSREAAEDAIRVTALAFDLCVLYIAAHVFKQSLTTEKTSKKGIANLSIWRFFGRSSSKTVPCHLLRTNTLISDNSKDNIYIQMFTYRLQDNSSQKSVHWQTARPHHAACKEHNALGAQMFELLWTPASIPQNRLFGEHIPPWNWFSEVGGGREDPRTKSIPSFKTWHFYGTWPTRFMLVSTQFQESIFPTIARPQILTHVQRTYCTWSYQYWAQIFKLLRVHVWYTSNKQKCTLYCTSATLKK
jgi:hypothetical protein